MSKPKLIEIEHDDHTPVTSTPFVPASGSKPGREFVAVFLFDKRCLEARIDDLGTRAELDEARARSTFDQRLAELGIK